VFGNLEQGMPLHAVKSVFLHERLPSDFVKPAEPVSVAKVGVVDRVVDSG
jgi:hypothetical protein